jgi:hypothetical protein
MKIEDFMPYRSLVRVKLIDSLGKLSTGLIAVTNLRDSYRTRIGATEKEFRTIIKDALLYDVPLVTDSLYGYADGIALIREDYYKLIEDLPLDVFLKTYFDNNYQLKHKYYSSVFEIMNRLYDINISLEWDGNYECYWIRQNHRAAIERYLNPPKTIQKKKQH